MMTAATSTDEPARLAAVLSGAEYAALVQRNEVLEYPPTGEPTVTTFTAVTLVHAEAGLITEVFTFVSEQDVVDALWAKKLG